MLILRHFGSDPHKCLIQNPFLGYRIAITPTPVAPAMLAPDLAVAMPGGQSVGASELVGPRPGMMLIFPSWLSHAVRPYHGDGVRISVAINLTPVRHE